MQKGSMNSTTYFEYLDVLDISDSSENLGPT